MHPISAGWWGTAPADCSASRCSRRRGQPTADRLLLPPAPCSGVGGDEDDEDADLDALVV